MGTFTEQAADYCGNFKQFLSVIEKYGNDPAVTWYTKKGEKQTRSYFLMRLRTPTSHKEVRAHLLLIPTTAMMKNTAVTANT